MTSSDTEVAAGKETICYCPNCDGWGTAPFPVECDACGGEGIVRCVIPAPDPAGRRNPMREDDIDFCSAHRDEPSDGDPCPHCGPLHPLRLEDRTDAAWVVRCLNCGWACEEDSDA